MAVEEHDRLDLFEGLREVLGSERAKTMMELMPPAGWGDVATKDDLHEVSRELRVDIESLRVEVRGDLVEVRGDLLEVRDSVVELKRLMVAGQLSLAMVVLAVFVALV